MNFSDSYTVIGVMSGTSLDGLDIAICDFKLRNNKWIFSIKKAHTVKYSKSFKTKLQIAPTLSGERLTFLDVELGRFIGTEVNRFCKKHNCKPHLVASHGHTVFHQPQKSMTLQIGNGAFIAACCKTTVVSHFRTLDVALKGQGAPLVPIGDELLFKNYDACLNLGGFANISFSQNRKRIAFDICPVNLVLNALANQLNKEYDDAGEIAKSGELNPSLLKQLNNLSFYKKEGPKSLGVEWVNNYVFPLLKNDSVPNLMRTFCEHASTQIANTINKTPKIEKVLATGGGAYNAFLIQLINQKANQSLLVPDKNTIEYKEALIFAFLGLLRFMEKTNTLKSVTGAIKDSSGGAIYLP
jgi:anhydro-N-acetylmuramic acid kinase